MNDETRTGAPPQRKRTLRMNAAVSRNDEFLFHLHRGSALLMEGDVHGAKVELEHALAFQPQDAKSQDLLAGVYFRLGLYPRAIEIWEALVDAFPAEPTLRINLGLAYFKTGQAAAAREQLRAALRDAPEHARAWGYLGLAEWRLGHLESARDAFARARQPAMVARMEQALAGASSAPPAELPPELAAAEPEAQLPPPSANGLARAVPGLVAEDPAQESPAEEDPATQGTALFARPLPRDSEEPRAAASGAGASVDEAAAAQTPTTHRLFAVPPVVRRTRREGGVFHRPSAEDEAAHVAVQSADGAGRAEATSDAENASSPSAASAHTAVTSPGAYAAPSAPRLSMALPVPLDALVAGALALPPEGEAFSVVATGELAVRSEGPVLLRRVAASALAGAAPREPLGPSASEDEPPSGREGEGARMVRWAGPLYALFAPAPGRPFRVIDVAGATLYLREAVLFGLAAGVTHEAAMLPLGDAPVPVVKLSGEGHAVLQLPATLLALPVGAEVPLHVPPERVLGWTGRLFPSWQANAPAGLAAAPRLAFRGEGAVLVGAPSESG